MEQESAQEKAEKAAWAAHCKAIAALETPAERFQRRVKGVVLLVVSLVAIALAWTGSTLATHAQGGLAASRDWGIAWTQSCARLGPISRLGLGYWWECQAVVHWEGDSTQPFTANFVAELSPDDIGKPVRVTSRHEREGSSESTYYRDTTHPWQGWSIVSAFAAFVILILGIGSAVALYLLPLAWRLEVDKKLAAKLRDQYQREGRGWIQPPTVENR